MARDLIATAKTVVPKMATAVIDRTMLVHGAKGRTEDTFLPEASVTATARCIRVGDGPDQVQQALGRHLLRRNAE